MRQKAYVKVIEMLMQYAPSKYNDIVCLEDVCIALETIKKILEPGNASHN